MYVSCLQVYFGDASNPKLHNCTVNTTLSQNTAVVCSIDATQIAGSDSQSLQYHLRVAFYGQVRWLAVEMPHADAGCAQEAANSAGTVVVPIVPQVYSVSGCSDSQNETLQCALSNDPIKLTIRGEGFNYVKVVIVGSQVCVDVSVTTNDVITCKPWGGGDFRRERVAARALSRTHTTCMFTGQLLETTNSSGVKQPVVVGSIDTALTGLVATIFSAPQRLVSFVQPNVTQVAACVLCAMAHMGRGWCACS